jgi:hypothetical protein
MRIQNYYKMYRKHVCNRWKCLHCCYLSKLVRLLQNVDIFCMLSSVQSGFLKLSLQEIKFRRILGFLSWHSKRSNSEEFWVSWVGTPRHQIQKNFWASWVGTPRDQIQKNFGSSHSADYQCVCVCVCVWASMCVLRWLQMLGNQGGQF